MNIENINAQIISPIYDSYAVFGSPISHSQSPRIHHLFAEQTQQHMIYTAQEVCAADFNDAAKAFFAQGGKGLNCTVPLKECAFRFAHHTTVRAQCAKAVNTLAVQADGTLLGDNTDGVGLVRDLTINYRLELAGMRLLILGAGGATRGILAPLLDCLPQSITVANRSMQRLEPLLADFAGQIEGLCLHELGADGFDIIINATPSSLSGESLKLPQGLLKTGGVCYDLAYAHSRQTTPFVQWGYEQNAKKSIDGLGMLVEQAAQAFYLWRGVLPQTQAILHTLRA